MNEAGERLQRNPHTIEKLRKARAEMGNAVELVLDGEGLPVMERRANVSNQ